MYKMFFQSKMILTKTLSNVLRMSSRRSLASSLTKAKEHLDPIQEASLKENCFLVDENDRIIGNSSKKDCHLVGKDGNLLLHRAFSVFLFNKNGHLLLQKRSSQKVSISFI